MTSESDPTNSLPSRQSSGVGKDDLKHAPASAARLRDIDKPLCIVTPVDIVVSSSDNVKSVSGFLHLSAAHQHGDIRQPKKTAAILLSGANGGVVGPSSIYLSVADKIASLSREVPVLRLDYRYPARNGYCVSDVLAAMEFLRQGNSVDRFVLVGWSFGGAPVFTVGGNDERVVACATIASQTAETAGIATVARRGVPVLLMHGTGDQRLSPSCSESLQARYNRHGSKDLVKLELFEGDDHSLTKHSLDAERSLCDFILQHAGVEISSKEQELVISRAVIGETDKIDKMVQGGDLLEGSIR